MHVNMKNALSCGFIHIHPNVVSIWMILFVNKYFDFVQKMKHVRSFFFGQVKKGCDMSAGNNESMAFRDRKTVIKSKRKV